MVNEQIPSLVPPLWGDYVPRRFQIADLEHLPSELPSGPVRYELHHGYLITLPGHGDQHGAVLCNFAGELHVQGQERDLGTVEDIIPGFRLQVSAALAE